MKEVVVSELHTRPFQLLNEQWAILVGGVERPNPMTVSWGGMGTLWNRPMVTIYVRPTRFTYELLSAHPEFTLNFLGAAGRSAMEVCGSTCGRSEDKWKLSGLVPEKSSRVSVPRVSTAHLSFECRIVAHLDVDPKRFLEPNLVKLYPLSDYHRVYFGEVLFIGERSA